MHLASSDIDRWESTASKLFDITPAILTEVTGLRYEPFKHSMARAAMAARYAAKIADEPLKTEAVALAEELEQRST
jgi:hypothetical protein